MMIRKPEKEILLRFYHLFAANEGLQFLTQGFGFFGVFVFQTTCDPGLQFLAESFLFQIVVAKMVFIDHLSECTAAHRTNGSIFHVQDRGSAVGNAVKELKKIATAVIGTNDEDSVAQYINKYVNHEN